MLKVEAGVSTDVGLVRRSNQDSYGCDEEFGLYVVCDGMGGAAAGDIASRMAAETFLSVARQELQGLRELKRDCTRHALQRAAAAANRAVVEEAANNPEYRGMGSTLVGARIDEGRLTIVNVGDSRAYILRRDVLLQLTEDHSYVAEQVRRGMMTPAQAEVSAMQSLITRAIGAEADVVSDVYEAELEAGDTLLLTSDGLTRHVAPEEIAGTLHANLSLPPKSACQSLVQLANERGGTDNITCLVLRVTAQVPGASLSLDSPSLCAR